MKTRAKDSLHQRFSLLEARTAVDRAIRELYAMPDPYHVAIRRRLLSIFRALRREHERLVKSSDKEE